MHHSFLWTDQRQNVFFAHFSNLKMIVVPCCKASANLALPGKVDTYGPIHVPAFVSVQGLQRDGADQLSTPRLITFVTLFIHGLYFGHLSGKILRFCLSKPLSCPYHGVVICNASIWASNFSVNVGKAQFFVFCRLFGAFGLTPSIQKGDQILCRGENNKPWIYPAPEGVVIYSGSSCDYKICKVLPTIFLFICYG